MPKCINCNTEVSETDKFCRNCGQKLVKVEREWSSEGQELVYERAGIVPQEILAPGEHLSFETRPILWLWLVGPILLALVGIIIAIAAQFFPEVVPSFVVTGITWLGIVILLVALLLMALKTLQWRYTAYAATNRRIIRQTGIISKSYIDCPIQKVQTIYLQIPFLGRLFGFGTIRFATAGAAWIEIYWENIKEPRRVQRMLSEIMDNYRLEVT